MVINFLFSLCPHLTHLSGLCRSFMRGVGLFLLVKADSSAHDDIDDNDEDDHEDDGGGGGGANIIGECVANITVACCGQKIFKISTIFIR